MVSRSSWQRGASKRLQVLKKASERGGADNIVSPWDVDVYTPEGEYIGLLLD